MATATKLAFGVVPLATIASGPAFFGPSPYLSFDDSPFKSLPFDYFHLEKFESGFTNLTGATINNGWTVIYPAGLTDSVDADDGIIDGSGTNGHSFFSGTTQSNLNVNFIAAWLGGRLPTHVGVVVTDVGMVFSGPTGVGTVVFSATDTNGMPLGMLVETNFGNGSLLGSGPDATAEDRFFGISSPLGIKSFTISVTNSADWEVDHLQFGYASEFESPPLLRINFAAPETIMLRWPTNAIGFLPQQADELPSTNWTSVLEAPVVEGADYQVAQTVAPGPRYFRLFRP